MSISQAQYDAGTCTLERVGLAHSRPETLSPGYFSTYPQVPFEMQEGPVFNFESGFTCPNAQVPGFLAATCGNHNGPGTGPVSCPGATVYAPYTADRRCTGFGDHPWKDDSSVLARDGRCDACAVGANTRQSEFGWGSPVEYDCSCSVGGCDGDCADCGTCGDRPVYTASGYDSGCDVSQEGKFDHPLCCVSPPIGAINLTVRRVPRPGDAGRVDDKVKVAFSNSLVQALRVARQELAEEVADQQCEEVCVTVSELAANVTSQMLEVTFSQIALVVEARVQCDEESGRSLGWGVVEFGEAAGAVEAAGRFQGVELASRPMVIEIGDGREWDESLEGEPEGGLDQHDQ